MRLGSFSWTIVLVTTLLAPGLARADFVPADSPTFVSQFQTFIHDFARWDTSHNNTPLVFLATTPEQQRSQALIMLWLLWMRDHGLTAGGGGGGGPVITPPTDKPPPSNGGGDPPPGNGGGGHPAGVPEPSSLALLGCGSLSLLAYRFVRSKVVRRR